MYLKQQDQISCCWNCYRTQEVSSLSSPWFPSISVAHPEAKLLFTLHWLLQLGWTNCLCRLNTADFSFHRWVPPAVLTPRRVGGVPEGQQLPPSSGSAFWRLRNSEPAVVSKGPGLPRVRVTTCGIIPWWDNPVSMQRKLERPTKWPFLPLNISSNLGQNDHLSRPYAVCSVDDKTQS